MSSQQIERSNPTPTITLYTTSWCGDCRRLKRRLDDLGVTYHEIDIETDREALEKVLVLNDGKRRIPTILVDDVFYPTFPAKDVLKAD